MRNLALLFLHRMRYQERSDSWYGYFEAWLSIAVNVVLFAGKFFLGVLTGSIALKADAFHTVSDVVTSGLVIAGFALAFRPPDTKHPFGHGRSEKIVSVIMATLLCVVAYDLLAISIHQALHPTDVRSSAIAVVFLAVSVSAKEFIYHVSMVLYENSHYQALKADAWHHRSDSIATLIVLIGFLTYRWGLARLDGILGIGVSLLIGWTGIQLIREVGDFLLGSAPHPDMERIIVSAVKDLGGGGVHHIHVHDYAGRLEITLHVRMRRETSLEEVHTFSTKVEQTLQAAIPRSDVTVHCEPERGIKGHER